MNVAETEPARLSVQLITQAAFERYGDVVTPGEGPSREVNGGGATRFDAVARLGRAAQAAAPVFALYRVRPQPRPLRVEVLERHARSSQLFVPMVSRPYVVAVAPSGPDGEPLLDELEAFVVWEGVGVHYRAGVWHMPMASLDHEALFAMWMWEAGDDLDTEERRLAEPRVIDF